MLLWCNVASCVKEILERMNGSVHYPGSHRESLTLPPPPPIPQRETRPRSAGYAMTANTDTLARTPTRGGNDYSSLPVMRSSRQVDFLYHVLWGFCDQSFQCMLWIYVYGSLLLILTAFSCHVLEEAAVWLISKYSLNTQF